MSPSILSLFQHEPSSPGTKSVDTWRTALDARLAALEAALAPALLRHPAADWLERLERAGVPCAPVNTVADAVRLPQIAARHMVVEVPDPSIGTLYVAGNPVKIDGVPDGRTPSPAPDLDGDRASILAWLSGATRP